MNNNISKLSSNMIEAYKRGYRVSNKGKLINNKGKEVKGSISASGYLYTGIRINGVREVYFFHRLKAYQKFGELLFVEGTVVRHLDGNPLNNSFDNIAIGTSSDNMMDIPESVRKFKSSKANLKHDHLLIVEDRKNGMKYSDIMKKYRISSKGTVSHIINKSYTVSLGS